MAAKVERRSTTVEERVAAECEAQGIPLALSQAQYERIAGLFAAGLARAAERPADGGAR